MPRLSRSDSGSRFGLLPVVEEIGATAELTALNGQAQKRGMIFPRATKVTMSPVWPVSLGQFWGWTDPSTRPHCRDSEITSCSKAWHSHNDGGWKKGKAVMVETGDRSSGKMGPGLSHHHDTSWLNPTNNRPKPSVKKFFAVGVASLVEQGNVLPLSLAVLGVALLPSDVVCEVAFWCLGVPACTGAQTIGTLLCARDLANGANMGPSGN
jgi:hypothetical protein